MESQGAANEHVSQLLGDGFAAYRQGDLDEAERAYRAVLAHDGMSADALMLLGLLLAERERSDEAEFLLLRFLTLVPDDAMALRRLGLLAQARGDDRLAIERLERAAALKPDVAEVHHALGASRGRLGDRNGARAHFLSALRCLPTYAVAWHDLGASFEETDELELAEQAYRQAIAFDPDCARAYGRLGAILNHLQRHDEAAAFWAELARRVRYDLSPCTAAQPEARILLVGGAAECNIRPKFLFPDTRFETVQVDLLSEADADETQTLLPAELGQFDLAFCLIADPDRGRPFFGEARKFLKGFHCPVLNPPDARLDRTRRDTLPALLQGIPGLVAPATRSLDRRLLEAMASEDGTFSVPLLVRPAGSHVGEALAKVTTSGELARYLAAQPYESFYVTDFCDYRSADGLHRKYRFIFVDRVAYPYHLCIGEHWMLHYFRAETKEQAWMRAEEEAFLAEPLQPFGSLLDVVAEIGRRLDLDYAGIDCGINAAGKLVLFEANASMLAHLNDDPTVFAYKHRHVPRIFDAMGRMVEAQLAKRAPDARWHHRPAA